MRCVTIFESSVKSKIDLRKLIPVIPLLMLLVVGSNCAAQITSCGFLLHDTSVCEPVVLIATANEVSTSPIVSRTWFLTTCAGTPVYTTNNSANSTFPYVLTTAGCYCLRLHSVDQNGDTCSYQKCNIHVANNPTLNFTFAPTEGCLPLTVGAQCNSVAGSGVIDSVVIDWGCLGPRFYNSCPTTPITMTYSSPTCGPGLQSPSIIIRNSFGCFAEKSFPNLINLIPNPEANFTADTTMANCVDSPLLVHFTADSADPNITYKWYINGSLVQSGTSRFLAHTFAVDSNCYDVKLVVSHPSGCGDSLTKAGYICVRNSPLVTFTQNSPAVCVNSLHPDSLIFQNTSPYISSLFWQLTGANPTQNFNPDTSSRAAYYIATPGTYTMAATGVYSYGCSSTITRQVLVTKLRPTAGFTQSDSISCKVPFQVTFNSAPCGGCTYSWSFSGGTPNTSNAANPIVTYNTFINSSVTLIVTGSDGCKDTVVKPGAVKLQPITPSFISNRIRACAPVCTEIRNTTVLTGLPPSTTITSTCWGFPGSTIVGSCQDSINVCFTQPGCYNVMEVITTNTGCIDSTVSPNHICVANPPNNTLTISPLVLCASDSIFVTIGGDTISYAKVNFGDNTGDQIFVTKTFSHLYPDTTGHFCVSVVTYRDSCKGDSLVTCVTVNSPIAKFTDSLTCLTKDTVFLNNHSFQATSYKWYFCNGDSSVLPNPFERLPLCDTCPIKLIAYNSTTGCSDKKIITVSTACDSGALTPVDTQGCAPFLVSYYNRSLSTIPGSTIWDLNCPNIVWTGPGTAAGYNYELYFSTPGSFCIAMRNKSIGGCIDTVYAHVTVCKLIANFGASIGCFPAPICFSDSSVDLSCGALNWSWSFGDSFTSNLQNPCHSYANPGTYHAKLVVTNSFGCKDSITKTIIISSPVHVDFQLDTFICPGSQNCINNNSTGVALVYDWIMPGASPDTQFTVASPCYSYQTPGDYPAYLHLSSNNQCNINDTFMVHVHNPIAGGFASSTYITCPNPPQLIVFTDTSQYADTLWHWSFGDNTFSNQQNTSHIYLTPGTFVVTETVTDKDGCANTKVIDTVTVAGPYGTVSYTPTAGGCACKDSVQFVINTSNAVNVILIYGCNTGFAQTVPTPIGSDSVPTSDTFMVEYCLRDTCRTKVVIDDATGCQVFLPDQLIYVDSPQVKIAFNSYGICYAGTVCFEDSTTYFFSSPNSFTTARLWDFGDGITDTSQNPCHYYSQPGIYNVNLYIHSNAGCFDSAVTQKVIIPVLPVAGYYADTPFSCANDTICFHDTSSTDLSTGGAYRVWDFGDGNIDTGFSSTMCHVYAAPGFYRVKLCVFDSLGCSNCDSASTIEVIANPIANAGGNQIICYGTVAQLNGVGGTNFHWSPPALFSNPNIYDPTVLLYDDTVVTFTVSNSHGCTNTDTIALSLARVTAAFNVPHIFCLNNSVCVTDSSFGINDSIISFEYDFGNGHVVRGRNNCYIYPAAGTYNITLIDIDNHGCTDTITKPVLILPVPQAGFSISDTVICSYQQICLTDLSTSSVQITNWLWNYGDNSGSSLSSPPCHTYNAPYMHSYPISLVVTDQNNCSDSVAITETVNRIPQAAFSWDTSCENQQMALTSTSVAGDGVIISCQWLLWLGAPSPVIDSNCVTSFRFPPGAHNVQLVVADMNGCVDTLVQPVNTDSLTMLTMVPGDTTICLGTSIDYQVGGVFNHINWVNNIWLSNAHSRVVTINPLGDVTYTISVQNGVCAAVSDSFSITVIQPVPIEVSATPEQIVLGLTSNITSQIVGPIDSIVWNPDSTLSCRSCPNPIATPGQTTTYMATVFYTKNGISCSNSAQVTIDVLNSCENGIIYVPNTFTPNGDGLNDVFMIRGMAATKINYFRVWDRWGRLVFEAAGGVPNDPQFGWDGNDRQGRKLNPDVYVYTYEIQCINGNIVAGQGNVTLVR